MLFVLITMLGPVSGAHFNPAVSMAFVLCGDMGKREAATYIVVQIIASIISVWAAHPMFDLSIAQTSIKARTGIDQWSAEVIATFGLVLTIFGGLKTWP